MTRRRLIAVPALLLGLAACGADVLGTSTVEEGVADALEEQVGVRPEVTCTDDLEAEVGASTRCTVGAPGDPTRYGVTVTVRSMEGERASFDVQVDDRPVD